MISRYSRLRITIPLLIILVAALTSPAFAGSQKSAKAGSGDPVFHSVSVSKTAVTAGETITVEVTADGGDSSLSGGAVMWESPSGQSAEADLSYDNATGKLSGPLYINDFAEAGEWACTMLTVYNENGGAIDVVADTPEHEARLDAVSITVANDNPDIDPPVLQSISVDLLQVKPGDSIKVTVHATDDISGIKGGVIEWGATSMQPAGDPIMVMLDYNDATGVLEGTATVPEEAPAGEWTVKVMALEDNAGNSDFMTEKNLKDHEIDTSLCTLKVGAVKASSNDVVPPVIISPTSGNRNALCIVDENPKKAGLQFTIIGMAVPGYKIELVCGGKTIASVKSSYSWQWRAEVTANSNLPEIYAIAISPNGQKSEKTSAVTRAQAVKLLMKAGSADPEKKHQGYFKDVPATSPYAQYIETAVELGIIGTDTSGLFMPNEKLSRGEFVEWFYSAYNGPDEESDINNSPAYQALDTGSQSDYLPYFIDVPESSPYAEYINTMYEYGAIAGNPNGTFNPYDMLSASINLTGLLKTSFKDVKADNWCAGYVYDLLERGIVSGYKGGAFLPRQTVTRAEFAKMLCKVKGWSASETQAADCIGVQPSHWAYSYVKALSQNNVIDAYPSTSFRPDQSLTRAEAVKMIVKAQGLKLDTTSDIFVDVIGHWASDYILTAKRYSLINGYNDGTFLPDNNITRAEAAKIIWQLH